MPHYNWRRSRPSSTESLIPSRQASRSSGSSSSEKRSPSPPNSVDYSHLQIEPITGNGSQTSTSTGSSRIETNGNISCSGHSVEISRFFKVGETRISKSTIFLEAMNCDFV